MNCGHFGGEKSEMRINHAILHGIVAGNHRMEWNWHYKHSSQYAHSWSAFSTVSNMLPLLILCLCPCFIFQLTQTFHQQPMTLSFEFWVLLRPQLPYICLDLRLIAQPYIIFVPLLMYNSRIASAIKYLDLIRSNEIYSKSKIQ